MIKSCIGAEPVSLIEQASTITREFLCLRASKFVFALLIAGLSTGLVAVASGKVIFFCFDLPREHCPSSSSETLSSVPPCIIFER